MAVFLFPPPFFYYYFFFFFFTDLNGEVVYEDEEVEYDL